MDSDDIAHKQKLLKAHIRRKRVLELQLAQFGIHADPGIRIELEDLEQEIQNIKNEIKQFPPTSRQVIPSATSKRRVITFSIIVLAISALGLLAGRLPFPQIKTPSTPSISDSSITATTLSSKTSITNSQKFQANEIKSVLFRGTCPGLYLIPEDIRPTEQMILPSNFTAWTPVPNEKGNVRILVMMVNSVRNAEYITLSNTMLVSTTLQSSTNIGQRVNIIGTGACEQSSEENDFSETPLTSDANMSEFAPSFISLTIPRFPRDQSRTFYINLQCQAPGKYSLYFKLPFQADKQIGQISPLSSVNIVCPFAFDFWNVDIPGQVKYTGSYVWDGSSYRKE